MFSKLLIANRGEIALRIMRTCDGLGVATAAVYSDADWDAPHVRGAGEAVRIGPPAPSASYLDIDAIIGAARATGAAALHPGYGFLSENPMLAEACGAEGITFVGPGPSAMRLLGDKVAARNLAERNGVPVLPGVTLDGAEGSASLDRLRELGMPLMVKASAGGGGRGMRLVTSPDDLQPAIDAAQREAVAAFGDGRLFVERAVTGARHVEVQVLADQHGNAVHLGERDCSTQRRHQKVIEESPAPLLDAPLRQRLGEAALTIARAAGYVNAGTVEFLLDRDGAFYFLEVNARLQVEHPVTEAVTGLDLVELQLRVAAGESLPFSQADVRQRGHAIEYRLTAEDPARGHVPASGRVSYFRAPAGSGVRVDSGIESGTLVPPEYDSLIAKVIVHGATRDEAIEHSERALAEAAVEGVTTNVGLLQAVLREPSFRAGTHDLTLLEGMSPDAFTPSLPDGVLVAAASSDVAPSGPALRDPWVDLGAWRGQGPRTLRYSYQGRAFGIEALRMGPGVWRFNVDGRAYDVEVRGRDVAEVTLHRSGADEAWRTRRAHARTIVERDGWCYVLTRDVPSIAAARRSAAGTRAGQVRAPMPGIIVRVLVTEGEDVTAHQPLAMLEAMKMEHVIESTVGGTVRRIATGVGERVAEGDILMEIATGPDTADGTS